jgi:hypothetical protein
MRYSRVVTAKFSMICLRKDNKKDVYFIQKFLIPGVHDSAI